MRVAHEHQAGERTKEIFNFARRLDSPEAVAEYLDQVCGDDQQLRGRVEELLRVQSHDSSFLEASPEHPVSATIDLQIREQPGAQIGPYKLLQQIGIGIVYLAQQTKPVDRRVALKIIKPGMDSQLVVARFEAD